MPDTLSENIADAIHGLSAPTQALREDASARLIAIGAPAVPSLVHILYVAGSEDVASAVEDSPLRRLRQARDSAICVLGAIGAPAVEPLIVSLRNESISLRENVLAALRMIEDPRASQAVRDLIYTELADLRIQRQRWLRQKCFIVLMIALSLLTAVLDHKELPSIALLGVTFLIGSAGFVDNTARIRRRGMDILSNTDDPRMIGVLAMCLSDRNWEIRHLAANALRKLMPRVRASDAASIRQVEMDALLKTLVGDDDPLRIAVLKGLEQIGDESALPNVEWIIGSSEPEAVRLAAEACLPFLRQRAKEARQAQVLLRAASPIATIPPETLLRPAQGGNRSESGELLRVPTGHE